MKAKKKAMVAIIVGAVLGALFAFFQFQQMGEYARSAGQSQGEWILRCLIMIPLFMLYAFGYAFGWKRCKGFLAGAAKVSADVAFFTIIFHIITGKGFGKGMLLAIFILCIAVSVVWLPGVVFGVKDLISERRQAYA